MPERNPPCGRAEALPSRGTSSSAPLILEKKVRSSQIGRSFTLLSRGSGHLATRVSRVTRKEGRGVVIVIVSWELRTGPFEVTPSILPPSRPNPRIKIELWDFCCCKDRFNHVGQDVVVPAYAALLQTALQMNFFVFSIKLSV